MSWVRYCQECGYAQEDKKPNDNPTDAYLNRKCKSCKSMSLDFGSNDEPNKPESEALYWIVAVYSKPPNKAAACEDCKDRETNCDTSVDYIAEEIDQDGIECVYCGEKE